MKNVMLEELYIISINILLLPLADVINAAERIYLCTYSLSQIILSTLLSYSAYFPSLKTLSNFISMTTEGIEYLLIIGNDW